MPKDDDISAIPSISAKRDNAPASAAVPRPRGGSRSSNRGDKGGSGGGGRPGLLSGFMLLLALVIGLSACVWAWQLQEKLTVAGHTLERYEQRIASLEDRLADTDEGMNQNATVQAAKIRELDTEVRKLWDNVWKRSKERFGVLEASAKRFESNIAANEQTLEATQSELGRAKQDLAKLQSVAGNLDRLMSSARSSQAEVERVADTLNAINLELSKLDKRVGGNEEWISAINAFRQTTNTNISQLQSQLRALQASAAAGG
jgi:chromosome segregation ATPase